MNCTIVTSGEELLLKCKNENEMPYIKIKQKLRETIWNLYCEGYDKFYLNCEYGVPLWAAEIICSLKMYNDIELNITIPYENQCVNWYEEHRDRYYNAHFQSDNVYMISTQYSEDCYDKADRYMIERSELLFIFGKYGSNLYSVDYAEKIDVEVRYCSDLL